jgi:DNA polymerase (family 10)
MDRKTMTERLETAVKSGEMDILAHPTCRRFPDKGPIDVDMDRLLAAAAEGGTVMEVNAFPERLDLNGPNVRKALTYGVKLSIGTDSHRAGHLRHIDLGVDTARRGWAKKEDMINTMPVRDLLRSFGD